MMKFRRKLRARDVYDRDAIEQLKQHKKLIMSDLSKTNRRPSIRHLHCCQSLLYLNGFVYFTFDSFQFIS